MRSSLKKIFAGVLVVAMLATTYSFDSLAVTLDTLVTKESTINQERNKNNQTKYFEQFLNEKNQLLMKGDEGDGSVLTTMPADNKEKDAGTETTKETTKEKKEVVITTMPSDDKISPDNFDNEKKEEEVEAEEDDDKDNDNDNEATKTEENSEQNNNDDIVDDKIDESIKVQISIDDEEIKEDKDFVVDNTALTNNKTNIEENNEDVEEVDTATDSEIDDTSNAVFGLNPDDSDINFLGFINIDYATYKDSANGDSRVYTIPITKAFRNHLIYKVKGQIDTDDVRFDKNIIEYDDFLKEHSESELIRFMMTVKSVNEDTGAKEPIGSFYMQATYPMFEQTRAQYDKNGDIIQFLHSDGTGAVSRAHTGMYLTRNSDNSITIHLVQRANNFLDSFEQRESPDNRNHITIPKYKVKIVFSNKETSRVSWILNGGTWADTSKRFETFSVSEGVKASNMPGKGSVKKSKYTLSGWKMYCSEEDCWAGRNGTILDNGIPAETWDDIWLEALWERSKLDVGDEVIFGKYYKYAGVDKKYPLEWKVIDIDNDGKKVKLLTKDIIDVLPGYDSSGWFFRFAQSKVGGWLNSLTNSDAFTDEERANMIQDDRTLDESVGPEREDLFSNEKRVYGESFYVDTKLTCLSIADVDKYRNYLYAVHSDYAYAKKPGDDFTKWWQTDYFLSTPVYRTEIINEYGYPNYNNLEKIQLNYMQIQDNVAVSQAWPTVPCGIRPTVWVNLDYNFGSAEDAISRQTKRINIPKELIYRKDGYNTAPKAHVIRPQEAADFYEVLGLNKDEINSINLGWDSNHRPKEAYEIIDYYSDLRVQGNWNGEDKSLDPVEANTVNATLLYNETSKKYDVYLFGMYAKWTLDGRNYGIYWDLDEIADEIKDDTGIDIKKHTSKVNWVIGDNATWIKVKAKFDTYEEGTAHPLPTKTDIAKAGHVLDGWYINSDTNTTYTLIPNTQTGEVTLTAKWVEAKVDLPISMMKIKSGNESIYITPDKTKWKSQLGLDGIEKIESLTNGNLDTTDKTLISTIKYQSTEFRELESQKIIASAVRTGYNLADNAQVLVMFDAGLGHDNIEDFTKYKAYDASYDHIENANIVAKVYKDTEGKIYVDLTEGGIAGQFTFYLPDLGAFFKEFPRLYWDLSDIDINSQDSSTDEVDDDDYQEGYDITWVLGEGKFKDEYKSYENALHKTTEDFILPGAETLDAPYRKVLKEWIIGGVATTSISKDIHRPVTVTAVWTRSVGNFESYSIGKYKSSSLDTEEETALEWIILDKVDGKLLLTTKDIIDNKSYDINGNAKFENSNLRFWLNGEFISQVFNDDQKANILKEGKDKVFLLNEREAKDYFANDIQRTSKATDHAVNVDNGGEKLDVKNGLAAYWLMTDVDGNKAPYVTQNGIVNTEGIDVASKNIGVRPCIWVSETKISNIRSNPLNKLIDTINNQIEHFTHFMNLFFGRKK